MVGRFFHSVEYLHLCCLSTRDNIFVSFKSSHIRKSALHPQQKSYRSVNWCDIGSQWDNTTSRMVVIHVRSVIGNHSFICTAYEMYILNVHFYSHSQQNNVRIRLSVSRFACIRVYLPILYLHKSWHKPMSSYGVHISPKHIVISDDIEVFSPQSTYIFSIE